MTSPCILIAGIGNIFLGDDAFGVEVVRQLLERPLPAKVRAVDFGIRGFDLAYALMEPWELAILVDALPRGGLPGTLYVLKPDLKDVVGGDAPLQPHGMDPLTVLRLVNSLGGTCPPLRVVGCEPAAFESEDGLPLGLSEAVAAAVPEAVRLVESLVDELLPVTQENSTCTMHEPMCASRDTRASSDP
jgi:hydrogenase maturation protease